MKVYARTKDGYIGEIVEVGKYTLTMSINGVIRYVDIDNVKKTSPLIIELVEIGDYVNDDKVGNIAGTLLIFYDGDGDYYLKNEEVIEILTHEQYQRGVFKI